LISSTAESGEGDQRSDEQQEAGQGEGDPVAGDEGVEGGHEDGGAEKGRHGLRLRAGDLLDHLRRRPRAPSGSALTAARHDADAVATLMEPSTARPTAAPL
jgi:hypothetical protein